MAKENKSYTKGVEWSKLFYINKFQLIQQNELELFSERQQVFNEANPCNIYMIIRRARVTVNPNVFSVKGNIAKIEFQIHHLGNIKPIKVEMEISTDDTDELTLKTEYPYAYFSIQKAGKNIIGGKASVFYDMVQMNTPLPIEELNLDVLYIGKSIDKTSNLGTTKRLLNHSKLQSLYKNEMTLRPDCDIWILLCSFRSKDITITGFENDLTNLDEEFEELKKLTDPKYINLTKDNNIGLIEATLINYFDPKYNKTFKNNFPSKQHKSYSEAIKKELNSLIIEIDTSEMNWCLYSEKVKRKIYHSIQYDFRLDKNRYSLYDITKNFKT